MDKLERSVDVAAEGCHRLLGIVEGIPHEHRPRGQLDVPVAGVGDLDVVLLPRVPLAPPGTPRLRHRGPPSATDRTAPAGPPPRRTRCASRTSDTAGPPPGLSSGG